MLKIQFWNKRNKLHFKIYLNVMLNCNNFSQYYCFYCIFDQHASFMSIRDFQNHLKKSDKPQTFEC